MVARQDFFFFFFVLEGGPLNLEPLIPELQLHRYSVFLFFFFSIFTGVTSDVRFFSSVNRAVVELMSGSLHSI